jgi:hypothetical protein
MDTGQGHAMSWPAAVAWVCVALFVTSLWNGSSSGPLFWAGAIAIDVLLVGWVYVLIRWITRRIDDRA